MNSPGNASYMQISRAALWQNAETVKKFVGVPVIGVVKCDGYGVSLSEAARAWQQAGVTIFAVSKPHEALELRQLGFREDILLMSPVADAEVLNTLIEYNIILTITNYEIAQRYHRYASSLPIRVHVAVDTGMGRFGVIWTDIEQLQAIYRMSGFTFEGIFSHFSKSFEDEYNYTKRQLDRFLQTVNTLSSTGISVGMRHIANSCAALRFPETRLDAVRIGSALVGKVCHKLPIVLHSVAQFKAQVVDCKVLQAGDTTGYASVCKVKKPTKAIVVAIGHEDGFGYITRPDVFTLRDMANYFYRFVRNSLHRPYVTYNNTQLPLIGRIGNQYTLFDATDIEITVGDYVLADLPLFFPYHRRTFIADE